MPGVPSAHEELLRRGQGTRTGVGAQGLGFIRRGQGCRAPRASPHLDPRLLGGGRWALAQRLGAGGGVPAWEMGWGWIREESEAMLRSVLCRRGELASGRWDLSGFRKQ